MRFVLIGDGAIAKYHREAIKHVGEKISCIYDPAKYSSFFGARYTKDGIPTINGIHQARRYLHPEHDNYIVICSPSYMHRPQIKEILEDVPYNPNIICEKPAFLPWEQIIENDRINVCLQLRYLHGLPVVADTVVAHFQRDNAYFWSWKGDPKKTGGLFFNLFIHYIDLACQLGADFEGSVNLNIKEDKRLPFSKFRRYICHRTEDKKPPGGKLLHVIDIQQENMQGCYNRMYEAILDGKGIHPKDLFYLDWILRRNSEIFGYGKNGIGKTIKIGKELL